MVYYILWFILLLRFSDGMLEMSRQYNIVLFQFQYYILFHYILELLWWCVWFFSWFVYFSFFILTQACKLNTNNGAVLIDISSLSFQCEKSTMKIYIQQRNPYCVLFNVIRPGISYCLHCRRTYSRNNINGTICKLSPFDDCLTFLNLKVVYSYCVTSNSLKYENKVMWFQ